MRKISRRHRTKLELTDEYRQVIDELDSARQGLLYENQHVTELAMEHVSDIAGICAIARACSTDNANLVPLHRLKIGEERYEDGCFLFTDWPGHVYGVLGINLHHTDKEVSGIEYYEPGKEMFISNRGKISHTRMSDKEMIDMVHNMLKALPGLKSALLKYVKRNINDVQVSSSKW